MKKTELEKQVEQIIFDAIYSDDKDLQSSTAVHPVNATKIFTDKIMKLLFHALAEREREIKSLIETYKSYYNPIGDERNKGKHEAMEALLSHLYPKENL